MTQICSRKKWAKIVSGLNDPANIPEGVDPLIDDYSDDFDLVTFSFHPRSVLTGDGTGNRFSTIDTTGSYVDYNEPFDQMATKRKGAGYSSKMVTADFDEQVRLYKEAIKSRNTNNGKTPTPDPARYQFPKCNCGTWATTIVERGGFEVPSNFMNFGTGLGYGLEVGVCQQILTKEGGSIGVVRVSQASGYTCRFWDRFLLSRPFPSWLDGSGPAVTRARRSRREYETLSQSRAWCFVVPICSSGS